ncbi:hypothetical protein RIF29_28177 [Crotalaria pallida]|uniref:Uncharacterized protein n=1 Tax=Crotalaria pallida TaxID=3830 RepID=A0AAN9EQH8_CROPI
MNYYYIINSPDVPFERLDVEEAVPFSCYQVPTPPLYKFWMGHGRNIICPLISLLLVILLLMTANIIIAPVDAAFAAVFAYAAFDAFTSAASTFVAAFASAYAGAGEWSFSDYYAVADSFYKLTGTIPKTGLYLPEF